MKNKNKTENCFFKLLVAGGDMGEGKMSNLWEEFNEVSK